MGHPGRASPCTPHHLVMSPGETVRTTHHIVAITLRKPKKSIVAARCTAWSGCTSSPLAVSHALKTARAAQGRLSVISCATVKVPSVRMNPESSALVASCFPWHTTWTTEAVGRASSIELSVALGSAVTDEGGAMSLITLSSSFAYLSGRREDEVVRAAASKMDGNP